MSNRRTWTVFGRPVALTLAIGLLAAAACTNPVGLEESATAADHTVSSGNHTVSSGNHTVSSGNASRADR